MATLEEIQLKFGQAIQLQLVRLEQSRLYSKLIGYLPNQAVIVTMPTLGESSIPVLEGEAFVCRAFAGRVAFGFETQVLKVSLQPFPHLYLAYPKQVEAVVVRKAARLPIQREAALLRSGEQGERREAATVVDISTTGACVAAKPEFAAVKDSVQLLLPAGKPDETEIRVEAVVRSARTVEGASGTAPLCQYGLEFASLTPQQSQAIEKLIQEQLTRGL